MRGPGIDPAAVENAPAMSEQTLCQVWAMLMAGTPITASFGIADG